LLSFAGEACDPKSVQSATGPMPDHSTTAWKQPMPDILISLLVLALVVVILTNFESPDNE